jgi:hypothetical protein
VTYYEKYLHWHAVWSEVFDQVLALLAFTADPESDLDLILAIEEHYGVVHEVA